MADRIGKGLVVGGLPMRGLVTRGMMERNLIDQGDTETSHTMMSLGTAAMMRR